jgi:Tol biopolymer transport system component
MNYFISRSVMFLVLSLTLIFSCQKNPTELIEAQNIIKPEILYVARKSVHQGWGDAVSINIMDAQGNNHREIISVNDGAVVDPYFSNDGEKIVFVMHSDTLGPGENLYTINYDGTGLSQITLSDSTLSYNVPQFTADKSKVVYQARVNSGKIEIRVLNIASKQQTILAPQTNSVLRPVLSPDGNYVFYNNIDGNVYKASLDGTSNIKLTDTNYTSQVQIDGTGTAIYFVSMIEHQIFDLFSMDLDGNDLSRVTGLNDLSCAYFRISSDGLKIINLTSSPSGHSFDIMDSNGDHRNTIQINKRCWSTFEFFPDGKNVIFEVDGDIDHNSDYHIYKIGISGENMTILSLDKYHDNQFSCFRPES